MLKKFCFLLLFFHITTTLILAAFKYNTMRCVCVCVLTWVCEFLFIVLPPILSAVQWSVALQHIALTKCLSGVTLLLDSC